MVYISSSRNLWQTEIHYSESNLESSPNSSLVYSPGLYCLPNVDILYSVDHVNRLAHNSTIYAIVDVHFQNPIPSFKLFLIVSREQT